MGCAIAREEERKRSEGPVVVISSFSVGGAVEESSWKEELPTRDVGSTTAMRLSLEPDCEEHS